MSFVFVYVTVPTLLVARELSRVLLSEKLIACSNFWAMNSLYIWENQVEEAEEYVLLLKTRLSLHEKLTQRVSELHPYQTPCITKLDAWPNEAFGLWIAESTQN